MSLHLMNFNFLFIYFSFPPTFQTYEVINTNNWECTSVGPIVVHCQRSGSPDVYVILAADTNYHYLLNTPFVVQHWANLGVRSAVLLAGTEEEYEKSMASKLAVEMLRELKAEIVFLENSNMTSGQLAQVSRNFAAGLPFAKKLRENTIFLTSDVDLFIFNKAAVLPDENETIHFYNNHTTRLKFRDLTFTMFNMGTIAANLSVWRDIMDIKHSDVVNGEYIEKSIQKEYGDEFAIKNKNKMFNWYLDQHFFSLKFHKYMEKNAGRIHYKFYGRPRRLDRGNWKYSPNFLITLNTLEYDDAHLDPAIFDKANWGRIWPLYKRVFGSGQVIALNEFRNQVIEHVNEENVKDVHP